MSKEYYLFQYSDDNIVLIQEGTEYPFRNILRCNSDGSLIWQAEMPTDTEDAYSSVEWVGEQLHANSWSCYKVIIDDKTVTLLASVFTK